MDNAKILVGARLLLPRGGSRIFEVCLKWRVRSKRLRAGTRADRSKGRKIPVLRSRTRGGAPRGIFPMAARGGSHEQTMYSGDDSKEDPPVPIPNTVVKLFRVDDTWRGTAWESRTLPERWGAVPGGDSGTGFPIYRNKIYSSIAQLVEHAAVNRRVVGSSPTGGARWPVGQAVKTPPFHGGNTSSILVRVTMR